MIELKNLKMQKVEKKSTSKFNIRDLNQLSKFDSISPPSVFIGSKLRYPNVNIGILSPINNPENASIYDDCKTWASENYSISSVLQLRQKMLNSRFKTSVHNIRAHNRLLNLAKDIAISKKSVDVEIELKNKINCHSKSDKVLTSHGLNAELKNANITSNVSVHKKVDKVINDDIKATSGMSILYKSGIDEYSISKILSVGAMGLEKNKRMVPTRFSITATDDIITKNILENIREFKWIEDYELFFGEFMGNQFLILLFPDCFSFELFELYYPKSSWNPEDDFKASHDYEGFHGRKNYASNCVGGYYAARIAVCEHLNLAKRQAGVLVVRLETPSYWASLGCA